MTKTKPTLADKCTGFVHRYPLTSCCLAAIWVLCFFTPPHTPLDHVAMMDKWTHFVMYGGTCSVIAFERLRRRGKGSAVQKDSRDKGSASQKDNHSQEPLSRLLLYTWLLPVAMSGLIELLQAYCTGGRRSGEWLDLAANSIGATLALMVTLIVWRKRIRI